jgi:hypothetical protein
LIQINELSASVGLLKIPKNLAARTDVEETMKIRIAVASFALLTIGFMAAGTDTANAVVYCQYVSYPAGCVVRPGVVLRPRPVARAVRGSVTQGTAINRGGPVNRVGRR